VEASRVFRLTRALAAGYDSEPAGGNAQTDHRHAEEDRHHRTDRVSAKDRGAAVLVSWLAEHDAEDSSGNAGAALAAYCARAEIGCDIYAPSSASPAKLAQIEIFGAKTVLIPGPRAAAAKAVETVVAEGLVYASHAWHPMYLAGTATFAFELWEQLRGSAPDVLVLPVGGGSLLLGAYLGFRALYEAGYIARLPRLVAAQATACAPLVSALRSGSENPAIVEPVMSVASGILIASPVRRRAMLAAIRQTVGTAVAIDEQVIVATHRKLARMGVFVELTSAVAVAALDKLLAERMLDSGERVVVALTGHGLKTPLPLEP
jgi:threonine synthase